MSRMVAVVDYGSGNLLSVQRALAAVGAASRLVTDAAEIESAEALVLPGVGAFGHAMAELRGRGLVEPLQAYFRSGRPFLGICLGMQMMLDRSSEFGDHAGLGLIPGSVGPLPTRTADGAPLRVPNVGWRALVAAEGNGWGGCALSGTPSGSEMYFVHSFVAHPADSRHRLADCLYGGHRLAAVINIGQAIGCQFHPEKSGPAGLAVLRRFIQLSIRPT